MTNVEKVENFKNHWRMMYSYISLEFSDEQIIQYMDQFKTVERACDMAQDYHLANGIGDVQE